jgi:uncharacterized membrane protein YbhN (UPF0104 family)
MANNKRWLNLLKLTAKILFSSLFLYLVLRKIQISDLMDRFNHSNPYWIMLAGLFFTISKWVSAIRLNHFFRNTGLNLSDKENTRLYWLGMFYNMFLPGGIGGDGYKIFVLNRRFEIAIKKLFWAVFLDRVSGVVALGILSGVLALVIFKQPFIIGSVLVFLVVAAVVYYFIYRRYFAEFLPSFKITNWEGMLVQMLQLVCAACIMKAIGIDDHYTEYLLVFLVSSVVAIFPFTIGGLGARELTFYYGALYFGLSRPVAITISFWFYLITLIVSLVGLIFVFSSPFKNARQTIIQQEIS